MSDLNRFILAQNGVYERTLSEIKNGHKVTHWMWYIFPQLVGLGYSEISEFYGIRGISEAKDYLSNEVLGARLIEISTELLKLETSDSSSVFGKIDSVKLRSSMTLFDYVSDNSDNVFNKVIEKYYDGIKDDITLKICDGLSKGIKTKLR